MFIFSMPATSRRRLAAGSEVPSLLNLPLTPTDSVIYAVGSVILSEWNLSWLF